MALKTSLEQQPAVIDPCVEISRCSSCGNQIALRAPSNESFASPWLCKRCGSVYFACCQQRDGQPHTAGVRPVQFDEVMRAINVHLQGRVTPVRASDVQRLVRCLAAKRYGGKEERRHKRFPVAAPVTVIPLGIDLRIAGQPSRMMTINVSGGGAALVDSRRVLEPYLAVDFAPGNVDLLPAIMRVTRVRNLGSAYEAAGEFLSRISK